MQITKDSTPKKLRELFQHFLSLKLLFAPTALTQYVAFLKVKKISADDVDNIDRLDDFFFKKCNVSKFPELSSEDSIVSKRIIKDHMHANNFKPYTFEITNDLKESCREDLYRIVLCFVNFWFRHGFGLYFCQAMALLILPENLEVEKKKQDNNKTSSEKQIIASEIKGAIQYHRTFGHLQNV